MNHTGIVKGILKEVCERTVPKYPVPICYREKNIEIIVRKLTRFPKSEPYQEYTKLKFRGVLDSTPYGVQIAHYHSRFGELSITKL